MKDIPVHQLRERTNTGLEIDYFIPGDMAKEAETLGAHRDDHYIFFLLEAGKASLMIDFNEVRFSGPTLYYVLPGQVHHRIDNDASQGWFLAIDTPLISPDYRNVFENQLQLQQPYLLGDKQLKQFQGLLCLLNEKYQEDEGGAFYLRVVHSLLKSFLGIAATCFNCSHDYHLQLSRPAQLSQQFKKILVDNIRDTKSPSEYAAKLNVSESYLNEVLKKTTGLNVSYWITQEVILEAKRLLYYSELNVKEIAHSLGYEDHAYFSRLFKRATTITPLSFRAAYRK